MAGIRDGKASSVVTVIAFGLRFLEERWVHFCRFAFRDNLQIQSRGIVVIFRLPSSALDTALVQIPRSRGYRLDYVPCGSFSRYVEQGFQSG